MVLDAACLKKLEIIDEEKNRISITLEQLKHKCRTCLLRDGLINVFTTQHKECLFSDLFDWFSLTKMSRYDGLPQKICGVCAKFIMDLHTFKQQIQKSLITFQFALGKHENLSIFQVNDLKVIQDNDKTTDIKTETLNDSDTGEVQDNNEDMGFSNNLNDETIDSDCGYSSNTKEVNSKNGDCKIKRNTNFNDENSENESTISACEDTEEQINESNYIKTMNLNKTFNNGHDHVNSDAVAYKKFETDSKSCHKCNKIFKKKHLCEFNCKSKKKEAVKKTERPCPICLNYVSTFMMKKHIATCKLHRHKISNCNNIELIEELDDTEIEEDSTNIILDHSYVKPKSLVELKSSANDADILGKKYKCEVCKSIFNERLKFLNHKKSEMEERRLMKCPICQKSVQRFKMEEHMHLHLQTNNDDSAVPSKITDYTCSFCNVKFSTRKQYLTHRRQEQNKIKTQNNKRTAKVPCPLCSKLINKYKMNFHLSTHSTEKPYMCDICGKKLRSNNSLKIHKYSHTEELPEVLCEVCGKVFKCLNKLNDHKKKIHHVKSYCCRFCDKSFPRSCDIEVHERSHTGERPFLCAICGCAFIQAPHLRTHTKVVHGTEKSFKCMLCDQKFALKDYLTTHMNWHIYGTTSKNLTTFCQICNKSVINSKAHSSRHLEEEPKLCEICNKVVHYPTIHMIEQHSEEKYICHICKKSFAKKYQLKCHTRVHKEKVTNNLPCDVCGKSFRLKQFLEIHRRIHTGERPYKCEECGSRFVQHAHLNSHMKTHRGEKTFCCPFCDKRFALNGNLKQHVMTHTGERPFICEHCSKGFISSSGLRKHLATHIKT